MMDSPVPEARAGRPAWAESASAERVGRFILGPELGRGALGRVVRAWDPMLRRVLALKLLLEPDPIHTLRLTQEAQLQAQVEHPGVCRIYEVGHGGTTPYIAMALLEGETLGTWAQGASPQAKVAVLKQVAEVLAVTHARGLAHLDLKPSNIQMERDAAGHLHPVLLDFGLARESGNPGLQFKGEGTPAFMSPEQARGDEPGPPSDLYSLCATTVYLLSGQRLEGPLPEAPPPGVPSELWPALVRGLAELPEDRYPSALALAEDLGRWLEGRPVLAANPSRWRRSWAWAFRRRGRLLRGAALAGLVLAPMIWGGITLRSFRRESAFLQDFTTRVQELEATLRVQRMLPPHPVAADLAKGRALVMELQGRRVAQPGFAPGATAYLLGRLHLALGDPDAARGELEAAVARGQRTPETWFALGKARSRLLARLAAGTERMGQGIAQDTWLTTLERLKVEAKESLEQGRRSALDPPELQEALLLLAERNYEEALARARAASVTHPWLYEPLALEGEVLLAEAQVAPDPAAKLDRLAEGGRALARAVAMAPSDPRLRELEVRRCQQALRLAWSSSAPMAPFEAALAQALAAWEHLDPEDPVRTALAAQSLADRSMRSYLKGKDPEADVQAALALAEQTLRHATHPKEALQAQAQAYWVRAVQAMHGGGEVGQAFEQSLACIRRALPEAPGDLYTWDLLSRIHRFRFTYASHKGADPEAYFEDARRDLAALSADPALGNLRNYHLAMVRTVWASSLQDRGRSSAPALGPGIADLQAICASRPTDNVAKFHLASALLMRGQDRTRGGDERRADLAAAYGNYEQSRRGNVNSFETHWGLMLSAQFLVEELRVEHRDTAEAMTQFRAALDHMGTILPEHWVRWEGEASYAYQQGRAAASPVEAEACYLRAETAIKRSLKANPGAREIYLWEARIQAALMGRPARWHRARAAALRALDRVEVLHPGHQGAASLRREILADKPPR